MDKKSLSERDICSKFISPAIAMAGWDIQKQVREEVSFTKGRIIVRGKLHSRGESRRADYILYHQPNLPIAVIEAKDNKHSLGSGMQQALGYAEALDVPFVFPATAMASCFTTAAARVIRSKRAEPRPVPKPHRTLAALLPLEGPRR